VWLFGLLAYVQRNVMSMIGYTTPPVIAFESFNPALAWQGVGGILVFVLVGLYMARQHLKSVVRKALYNDPEVDDSRESMSYRSAAILLGLSLVTLEVFLCKMGMSLTVATALILVMSIFYLAVTRFVIEGGLVLCRPPAPGLAVVIGLFGTNSMSMLCLGGLAACATWVNDLKAGFMPAFANALKLTENDRMAKTAVLRASIYALVVGTVFCVGLTLILGYEKGAANGQAWLWNAGGKAYFRTLAQAVDGIATPDTTRLLWGGIGMAVMGVLTIGRYNFAWWPIHPIGFPVATTWGVQMALLSIFVAWGAKTILLRIGGVALYTKAKPFFIGLLIGHLIAVAISYVCNLVTGPPGVNVYV
jgi:hypothetical protein